MTNQKTRKNIISYVNCIIEDIGTIPEYVIRKYNSESNDKSRDWWYDWACNFADRSKAEADGILSFHKIWMEDIEDNDYDELSERLYQANKEMRDSLWKELYKN